MYGVNLEYDIDTKYANRKHVWFQVMPILQILYHAPEKNSHHIYMALIVLLILSEDDIFNKAVHEMVCIIMRFMQCILILWHYWYNI